MKLHARLYALASVLFSVFLLLAFVPTQARYDNTVTWNGIYDPGTQEIGSNYLTDKGQTVLLQPWAADIGTSRTEEILFYTNKGAADAVLSCSTDSPYIRAEMDENAFRVTQGGYVVNLKLTITEAAEGLQEQVPVRVRVTLEQQDVQTDLWADFQFYLIPSGEEEPDYTVADLTELSVTPGYDQRNFAWEEKLVFTLAAQGEADTVEFMYNGDVFPEGLRYTVDGEGNYVLGDAMTIAIPLTGSREAKVCLDFSDSETVKPQIVTITATAYLNDQITGQTDFAAPVTREPLLLDSAEVNPVIVGQQTLMVPMSGDETGLSWKLEHLILSAGNVAYAESDDMYSLTVRLLQDENGQNLRMLEISNEEGNAPAGTYRLTMVRMADDVIVNTCEIVFFIHY